MTLYFGRMPGKVRRKGRGRSVLLPRKVRGKSPAPERLLTPAARRPVCFFTFSTMRPASASKSSSVSVRSAGWIATSIATDFLPSPSDAPSNTSNTETPVISFLSAPAAARDQRPASTALSTTKAKSRFTAWKADSSSFGLVRVGLAFGSGIGVDEHLEAGERARNVERLQRLRMELAEMAEHGLRAELDHARSGRDDTRPGPPASICSLSTGAPQASSAASASALASNTPTGCALPDQWRPAPPASPCRGGCRRRRGAACPACRPHRCPTLRTARRRQSRGRHCAARRRSAPAAARAACPTCRRRSGWQASAPAGRRRRLRRASPE